MDPDEVIRALVSVGLVVTMSLGANCQGAAGQERRSSDVAHAPGDVPAHAVNLPPATTVRSD